MSGLRTRAVLTLVGLLATLSGCTSPAARLEQLARQQNHRLATLSTTQFNLRVSLPNAPQPDSRLRVYLEGDGRAWITATQPSLDPTPRDLLLARLALSDPRPSVYLARPCQFVQSPGCTPQYWTHARFAQEIVDSLSEALDQLQRQHGNRDFELIGYSGGGAQVQTLAGVDHHAGWLERWRLWRDRPSECRTTRGQASGRFESQRADSP